MLATRGEEQHVLNGVWARLLDGVSAISNYFRG